MAGPFERAFNPAFQQSMQNAAQMREREMIEQLRQAEEERRYVQAVQQAGLQPIKGQDGKIDRVATGLAMQKQQQMQDVLAAEARQRAAGRVGLEQRAQMLGLQPGDNLARQVFDAEQANAIAQRQRELDVQRQKEIAAARERQAMDDRQRYRTVFGAEPSPTDFGQDGLLAPPALQRLSQEERRIKTDSYKTATERNAENAAEMGVRAGTIPAGERDQAAAVFVQSGGRPPAIPSSERDLAAGNVAVLRGLLPLVQKVRSLRGRDIFGPIEFRARTAAGSTFGGENDARSIEQAWREVSSGRAFAQGGKQLTITELQAIIDQVGQPTSQDFPVRLDDYVVRAVRDARMSRDRLADSPWRYTPEGQQRIRELDQVIAEGEKAMGAGGLNQQEAQGQSPAQQSGKFKIVEIR